MRDSDSAISVSRTWPGASPTLTVAPQLRNTFAVATITAGCVVICGLERTGSTMLGFKSTRRPLILAGSNPTTAPLRRMRRASPSLIHEALHYAGLPEQPSDPHALSPLAISSIVAGHCGF